MATRSSSWDGTIAGVDERQFEAVCPREPVGDVEIGRKIRRSDRIRRRHGASARSIAIAAPSALKRFTDAELATMISPARAYESSDLVADALGKIESSRRWSSCESGRSPHSSSTTCGNRSATAAFGSMPSELPSR